MASLAAIQAHTARAFIDGYDEFTAEGLLRVRADDCVNVMIPSRLGRPNRSNAEVAQSVGMLRPILKDIKMSVNKIINDPEEHAAVVHVSGSGETPIGPYANEHVFFLGFTEDGTKVNKVEEFVDTGFSEEFVGRMKAHMSSK